MHERSWYQLSRKEQDLYLRLLWEDGHSEKAIADFFGTTKNTVVRRRHSHPGALMEDRSIARRLVERSVDPERFRDLLDLHAMRELEAKGVPAIAPIGTCQWPLSTGRSLRSVPRCGKPVVPGFLMCREHLKNVPGIIVPE